MTRYLICAAAGLALTACTQKSPEVRLTHGVSAPVQTASRSEPVFYNGKTYKLDYDYAAASGGFNMRVSGMGPAQQADAVGLSTSALGHFACPSGHASLSGKPNYAAGVWSLPGRCA